MLAFQLGWEFVLGGIGTYAMVVSFTAALVIGIWDLRIPSAFLFSSIVNGTDCLMLIPVMVGTNTTKALGRIRACF